MKKLASLLVLFLFVVQAHAQIALSMPFFAGKDAKQIKMRYSGVVHLTLPLPIALSANDSVAWYLLLQPGYEGMDYAFKDNLVADRHNNYTSFAKDPDATHVYKKEFLRAKSQLGFNALYLPLQVVYRKRDPGNFFLAAGMFCEYITGGGFARRYYVDGTAVKVKDKFKSSPDFYGINRFQYGAVVNIAYRFISLRFSYSFSPLFKPGEGIAVHKFEAGIGLNFLWRQTSVKYKLFKK